MLRLTMDEGLPTETGHHDGVPAILPSVAFAFAFQASSLYALPIWMLSEGSSTDPILAWGRALLHQAELLRARAGSTVR